ncbi:LysR family transcriptional regulator [Komagataeibacter sp. FXV3]|nr:LysR family transcriptional regulator [Komagataeibacter sp. FXV3]
MQGHRSGSAAINALEQRLCTRLLHRSTRHVRPDSFSAKSDI